MVEICYLNILSVMFVKMIHFISKFSYQYVSVLEKNLTWLEIFAHYRVHFFLNFHDICNHELRYFLEHNFEPEGSVSPVGLLLCYVFEETFHGREKTNDLNDFKSGRCAIIT